METITVWMFAAMLSRCLTHACPTAPRTLEELNASVQGAQFKASSGHPVVVAAMHILKLTNPFGGAHSGFLSGAWVVRQHMPFKMKADGSDPDHLIVMFVSLIEAASSVADGIRYVYLLSQNRLPGFHQGLLALGGGTLPPLGEDVQAVSALADALQAAKVPITSHADVLASNRNYNSIVWGLKAQPASFTALATCTTWRSVLAACRTIPVVKAGFSGSHFMSGLVMAGSLQTRFPAWRESCGQMVREELFGRDMELADFAGYGSNTRRVFRALGVDDVKEFYVQWFNSMRREFGDIVIDITFAPKDTYQFAIRDALSFENPQSQLCMTLKKLQQFLGSAHEKNIRRAFVCTSAGVAGGAGGAGSDESE